MDKVCIIIPVYNTDRIMLIRCLICFNNPRFEVVIVDDNSTNIETLITLDEFKNNTNIHIIRNDINLGAGEARKKGIKYGIENGFFEAKYFGFCDSDDTINIKEYLDFLDQVITSKSMTGVARVKCYFEGIKMGFNSRNYNTRNKSVYLENNPGMLRIGPSLLTCRLFSTKLANLFDIDYLAKSYEDTEILYYVMAIANSIFVSDRIVYNYFQHKDSLFFTNMNPNTSNGLQQIMLSSDSRTSHFNKSDIYEMYKEPLGALELTFFLQCIKRVLRTKNIINNIDIASYIMKIISIRMPEYERLFSEYTKLSNSPYWHYTEF